jgi:hypothetical protein
MGLIMWPFRKKKQNSPPKPKFRKEKREVPKSRTANVEKGWFVVLLKNGTTFKSKDFVGYMYLLNDYDDRTRYGAFVTPSGTIESILERLNHPRFFTVPISDKENRIIPIEDIKEVTTKIVDHEETLKWTNIEEVEVEIKED